MGSGQEQGELAEEVVTMAEDQHTTGSCTCETHWRRGQRARGLHEEVQRSNEAKQENTLVKLVTAGKCPSAKCLSFRFLP